MHATEAFNQRVGRLNGGLEKKKGVDSPPKPAYGFHRTLPIIPGASFVVNIS